jgi:hypothetical protein
VEQQLTMILKSNIATNNHKIPNFVHIKNPNNDFGGYCSRKSQWIALNRNRNQKKKNEEEEEEENLKEFLRRT